ncbi:Cox19-like CHCH family protein [Striga hermonthica]|uniref:Cox19-like CHCH family protein n=1 Tax=Striga hermonthica TaxID=68872 RepID=A0A9N7R0S5_STRHE|nr:Cox19-like CHCH family protein [Striga hermonthica]
MAQPPEPSPSSQPAAALHQNVADEDDENVKQLRECSSSYIALQDCLISSNRNWKSCQKAIYSGSGKGSREEVGVDKEGSRDLATADLINMKGKQTIEDMLRSSSKI